MNHAILLLLCCANSCQEERAVDARAIVERARAAMRVATEAAPSGKCTGILEQLKQQDGDSVLVSRATFEAFYDGPKTLVKLQYEVVDGKEPDVPEQIILNDGQAAFVGAFSKRIYPLGASGAIHELEQGYSHVLPVDFGKLFDRRVLEEDLLGKYVVKVREEQGFYILYADPIDRKVAPVACEWSVDPNREYHTVRLRTVLANGDYYSDLKTEKERFGDFWYVRLYEYRQSGLGRGPDHITRAKVTTYDGNVQIPASVFTIDALGLPPGTSLTDYRQNPPQIISAGPPETDAAELEKVIGKLPMVQRPSDVALPQSQGLPPLSRTGARWPWVLGAVGLFLCTVGVVLWSRRTGRNLR